MNRCIFSPCRRYRYTLRHGWDDLFPGPTFAWIGLNPSTADEGQLDPTLRRVKAFTVREGGTSFVMLNLFAFRATYPQDMMGEADPVGPDNDRLVFDVASAAGRVIACWGAHGGFRDRAAAVAERLRVAGITLWCLGRNNDGTPKHPLYVDGARPLEVFA